MRCDRRNDADVSARTSSTNELNALSDQEEGALDVQVPHLVISAFCDLHLVAEVHGTGRVGHENIKLTAIFLTNNLHKLTSLLFRAHIDGDSLD